MFSHPWLLIGALFTVAVLYIVIPASLFGIAKYRDRRTVRCPETQDSAEVLVHPLFAAASEFQRVPVLRIKDCSRWPGRANCDQNCLREHDLAPTG